MKIHWLRFAAGLLMVVAGASGQMVAPVRGVGAEIWTERSMGVLPKTFGRSARAWKLNTAVLRRQLVGLRPGTGTTTLTLPGPDGSWTRFQVWETEVLGPELASRYPQIHTYAGVSLTDSELRGRFDLTPEGFHALTVSPRGYASIDPIAGAEADLYASAYLNDQGVSGRTVKCGQQARTGAVSFADPTPARSAALNIPPVPDQVRTYRLAVSTSAEYTAKHGGTEASATAAVASTVNRVNAVYERDMAMDWKLVSTVVFTDAASQPFTDKDSAAALEINHRLLGDRVGYDKFDLGHLFVMTAESGFGDFEGLCSNSNKGAGVSPVGVYTEAQFAVEMVSHEIGHQLDARHTFNSGSSPGCKESTREATSAYEVGSGVTIMSYAGICGGDDPQDLDSGSLGFFHTNSIRQMLNFVNAKATACSLPPATSARNSAPVVTAPASVMIPAQTAFELSASASDPDPQDQPNLTYGWEEIDLGSPSPPNDDDGSRPLFRNYTPSKSGTRTFPSMKYILENAGVPPVSYRKDDGKSYLVGETLPKVDRTMNFRVTVRDNRTADGSVAGSLSFADTAVTVVGSAGPFVVTEPNTAVSWTAGQSETVRWNVAKTNEAPLNVTNVRVLLSTDGGESFPIVLADNVPNNGSATFTLPSSVPNTAAARIRVQGATQPFFDISDANFTITGGGQGPSVAAGGIANAASFAPSVAPGSLFSIFGANFASASASASTLPLPTTLGGVQVLVNGHAIPLVFVGAGQINAQLPFDVPSGPATLAVSVNGNMSTASSFTVDAAAPGIFQFGANRAIVVNQDGRLNNTDTPAAVGSAIVAYTTGGGAVSTAVAAGTASPTDPLARLTGAVTATIGGQPAAVYFAGLTPGFVGLVQVNLAVPDLPTGAYPIVITVGGKSSNAPLINVVKQ